DDDDHTLRGIRKVLLRYFYNDPSYVRELYCYRLYEKYGVWTSLRDSYCRLWIHVEGDDKEAYFGVYTLLEPVDKRYLKDREEQFGSSKGYLWKASLALADLRKTYDALFGTDDDPEESAYALKTRTEEFTKAKQQLINFIDSLNTPSTIQFQHWIERVCDVNLLLKTYAVMVTVGNWDDYWNNANNYYIYFNSTHPTQYKMFFIPFDLDNTLGSSREVEAIVDTGRQNPLKWGQDDLNPLIARIIAIPKYRQYYIGCLKELIDPNNHLFDYQTSVDLIKQWQNFVKPYVPSDVDRDDVLADRPNPMGNMPQYRLLSTSAETNFFKVRTAAINQHINNDTP
ncbi:MAG: CotH kinase family protein, partial [Muribaculaceae bacterium]|nr:CotH kinase family protein [Muribaculaceae bacterium]